MIRAFIIDDEEYPRTLLKYLIVEEGLDIEVVGEAERLQDGIDAIKQLKLPIDVLFLDIEMPQKKGIEILDYYPKGVNFEIVFITAYQEYAIQAIRLAAFDYLLKPIELEELKAMYQRLKLGRNTIDHVSRLSVLQNNLDQNKNQKYYVRGHSQEFVIEVNDIIYLEASGMYTNLYCRKGRQVVTSKPLKDILIELPDQFIRCHRSYAFNKKNVSFPLSLGTGMLTLIEGKTVPLSTRRKTEVLERILGSD
jgi:two-component system LytT family response regulator